MVEKRQTGVAMLSVRREVSPAEELHLKRQTAASAYYNIVQRTYLLGLETREEFDDKGMVFVRTRNVDPDTLRRVMSHGVAIAKHYNRMFQLVPEQQLVAEVGKVNRLISESGFLGEAKNA